MENKTIANILAEHIATYKKSHPNLSSQQIAKKFGVTSSSFNRIEKGDVSNPTIDQVVKILGGVGRHAEIVGYLSKHYPIVSKTFRDFYTTEDGVNSGDKLSIYIQKREFALLILYTLVCKDVTKSEIKRVFGEIGELRLEKLIEENVISVDMKGFVGEVNHFIKLDPQAAISISKTLLDECFEVYVDGDWNSMLWVDCKRVKKDVVPEVINILNQAYKDIDNILSDEKNEGDHPMFYLLCTDSLYPKIK
ncbi:hypothetical protein BMS_0323 [Halobacteriovorax marinus SJ]|uniref:HTH cro/C1-type domain-containing protein n=1 Tax=Halobacteriovorax marinus (strain ATCC BAA-682 / DSM 15412 / SJ) TaxID=862908 RepID=E1X3F3_HALMS|nr:XRE family transcriptional regulator [Halobacteriovorax marinus]CBW25248.1 hypothetical protein BMS_0323 [Halobacteriovorax marinus SJ]